MGSLRPQEAAAAAARAPVRSGQPRCPRHGPHTSGGAAPTPTCALGCARQMCVLVILVSGDNLGWATLHNFQYFYSKAIKRITYLKEIKIEKEEETQQGDFETLGVSGKRRPSSPSPERPGEWPGDVTHFPSAHEFGGRVLADR